MTDGAHHPPTVLRGTLVDGAGQGQHFTGLEWVRRRFRERLGLDPYPGTVNVCLAAAEDREALERLLAAPGTPIPPEPGFCAAIAYRAIIEGPAGGLSVPAAIVVPDVPGYPRDRVELIAAVAVRATLNLRTGDPIIVRIPG